MYRRLSLQIISLALLIVFASSLAAYSLLEAGYEPYIETYGLGNYVGTTDARSSAMGGANTSGGLRALDAINNPANLANLETGFGAQLNFGIMRDNDRRSMPLYSFFDEYVDETTYANNSNWYDEATVGAYYRMQLSRLGFAVSLNYTPRVNFDANYEEDVRNKEGSDNNGYPKILAFNSIESEGAIRATSLMLAGNINDVSVFDQIALGIEIAMYEGEHNRTKKIVWSDDARLAVQNFELPDYYEKMEREFSGTGFKLGLNANFAERYSVGFAFTPKTELSVDYKFDGVEYDVDDYVMPSRIRFGVQYRPQNIMETYFNVDMEIVNWSDVEDNYDDVFNFYIGVEHKIFMTMPIRLGFRYETNPIDNIAMPTYTCGTGFQVYGPVWFDFSMEYSHRKYQAQDLFPNSYYNDENYAESASYSSQLWEYDVPEDRDESDKVDETFLKFQTALSVTF